MPIADLRPLWKFSWPNGEQVYVSQRTGDVEQSLAAGPVEFLDRVVLTTHDGSLLVIQRP